MDEIKEIKETDEMKNVRIAMLIAFLITVTCIAFPICYKPELTTVYVKEKITISNGAQGETYELLDPIQVVKNDKKDSWSVYNYGVKIGTIDKNKVVFENTPEYEQLKKIREEQERKAQELAKKQEEQRKKEEALRRKQEEKARLEQQRKDKKELAELQGMVKRAFVKIEFLDNGDDSTTGFNFYTYPQSWYQLNYDEQVNAFSACVRYVELKMNVPRNRALRYTRIINIESGWPMATESLL